MSVYANIKRALDNRLYSFATAKSLPVNWPNAKFTIPEGGSWLHPTVKLVNAEIRGLGAYPKQVNGYYHVNIFVKELSGSFAATTMADDLMKHFPDGSTYVYNGTCVHITKTEQKDGSPDGNGYYMVPVLISWRTITEAP